MQMIAVNVRLYIFDELRPLDIEPPTLFKLALQEKLKSLLEGKKRLFYKYPLTTIEVFEGTPLDRLIDKYREAMLKWAGVWNEVGTEVAKLALEL